MDQKKVRLLKNLSTGLVIAAVVFAFLIAGIRIFGVQVYGVLTGSMEPSYPTGSLIYVKPVDASELRVNDVITFSISPGVIATHRIVELVPDEQYPTLIRYRTKGDANRDVDASLVSANNIIGKAMFAVPQLGYVANYIQQAPGIYVAILVCGLMIAFVFYTDSLEEKQKKQGQQLIEEKPGFDLVAAINQVSQKLLGRDLIQPKAPPEPALQQGYTPQQPVQYNVQQAYPQGQYPQYPQYMQYPQQNAPMQMYQPPYYGAQQPYPQQVPPQGYPQPNDPPQSYGQMYQQPVSVQQAYPMPQNAPWGVRQPEAPVQQEQRMYPQQRS